MASRKVSIIIKAYIIKAYIIPLLDHTALNPECFTILIYPPKERERVYILRINEKVRSSFVARFVFCLHVSKPKHKIVGTQSQTLTLRQSSKPTKTKELTLYPQFYLLDLLSNLD